MKEITVRQAPDDFGAWDEVIALILEAFAYMNGRIDPPSSALRMTPASTRADARRGAVFLAEHEGELLGCVFTWPAGDALYLSKVAVRPAQRGYGIGRQLVAAATSEARRRHLAFLELQTRIELVENHNIFARLGFTKTGDTAHDGYARATSITMRKRSGYGEPLETGLNP